MTPEVPASVLLRVAVAEYRFQASHNWARSQCLLVVCVGLLVAGAGLMPGWDAALLFGLGLAVCCLSVLVVRVQHGYYRAARDRMRRVEAAVGVPEACRTDSTSSLGGRARAVSVTSLLLLLFGAVGAADLVGLVLALPA